MAYKQYRLSDIAMVEISGVDKKYLEGESEVQLCNFVDVYRNWAITSNMTPKFMIATARPNEIQRFKLKRGQVALTKDSETRYDIGISTYIADDLDNVILGYHNALITPNPDKLSGKYLNALLHTDYAKKYFANNASGSGQRYALGVDALNSFPVYIPQLAEQERIGEIFSLIDRKIALNRQINDNLEAMAKQLYDYWFVQFDFPDENGKPYKSSGGKMVWNEKLKREIPESWSVSYWGELVRANRGISYNTQSISGGGVPMINLASFNINGTYKHSGLKTYNGTYTEDKVLHALDLVMCNTQQTAIDFSKDIIAKAFLIPDIFEGEIVSSHHITTLQTDQEELKPYLSYLTNTYHFHKYAAGCCSGTNIMGLNYDGLKQYPMEVPDLNTLKAFMSIVYDVERRKGKLLLETEQLMSLRDEILPMLLNGQVSVNYHLSDD